MPIGGPVFGYFASPRKGRGLNDQLDLEPVPAATTESWKWVDRSFLSVAIKDLSKTQCKRMGKKAALNRE